MPGLRCAAVAGLLFILAACDDRPPEPARLDLAPVGFDALPGWRDDRQSAALAAFRRSCTRFDLKADDQPVGPGGLGGLVADWRPPCLAAAAVTDGDEAAARAFFEERFAPFRASDGRATEGLFTGYYEPLLSGARQYGGRYTAPIYGRPADLVSVDLGAFQSDLRGRRIAGRVGDGALRPYESRAEIQSGALAGRVPVLAWLDDPVDAFFLHVQGSGRIVLDDGGELRVGYAGSNGHAYVSIGRVLIERGELDHDAVTMQAIRAWLEANPEQARALMDENPSFVFFRELEREGPVGSQGAVLTPGRSLAVDRRHIPLGAPIWLDIMVPAAEPEAPARPLRRLVVAQDTGSAIKGPLRGDLFWGSGPEAEAVAGRMKHHGRLYLLLPLGAVERRGAASSG